MAAFHPEWPEASVAMPELRSYNHLQSMALLAKPAECSDVFVKFMNRSSQAVPFIPLHPPKPFFQYARQKSRRRSGRASPGCRRGLGRGRGGRAPSQGGGVVGSH
jgi:hypothetical protein